MRTIRTVYQDPLDLIWIAAARNLGIRVERDPEVFAAWDGRGTLRIGTLETLDPDDSLAQMVFHEICHALVEGPEAFTKPDWGLQIDNPLHRVNEHAALRLQARLADPFGLRCFFAATTDFREYFDRIPVDAMGPLLDFDSSAGLRTDSEAKEPPDDEERVGKLVTAGWDRAVVGPWSETVANALKSTSELRQIVAPVAPEDSLWISREPSR